MDGWCAVNMPLVNWRRHEVRSTSRAVQVLYTTPACLRVWYWPLNPTAICTVSCQSNSLRQLSGTENLQLCSFSQCHLGLLVKKIRKVGINEPLRLHNHWWLTQGKKQPFASHKPTMAVTQRGQYFAEAYVVYLLDFRKVSCCFFRFLQCWFYFIFCFVVFYFYASAHCIDGTGDMMF